MKSLFAAALVAGMFMNTAAGAVTGDELRKTCLSRSQSDRNFCRGYLLGAAEQLQAAEESEVCLPNGTTGPQFRAVFLRFMESRPYDRNINARVLVAVALEQVWPCLAP